MELNEIIDLIIGPSGGLFALGLIVGGVISVRYVAPRIYDPRLQALEAKVRDLEAEIEPYRDFKLKLAFEAMESKKV